jgi:hypothetical protein
MNPPPALVAAFVARLDRVLEHMRGELRPGDVLVYRAVHWSMNPGELAPPPPADQLLTAERSRVPVPLTVAEALATVTAARGDLAAAFAEELGLAVADLMPAEHQAGALEDPAVLAAWPVRRASNPGVRRFPGLDGPGRWEPPTAGPVEALSHLLERAPTLPGEPPVSLDTLPAVASWARGAPLVDEAGRHLGSFPSAGLNALHRHLVDRSPLFAAVEAGRAVRELTAGTDPGPAYLAAVRDALGMLAESDALAAAALEVTPDARRRLPGFAVELLDAARKVAPLFAVDPADDNAARETAETPNGPALRWDVAFAAVGLTAERADTVRENAARRWAAVYGPQVPIPDTPRPRAGSLWNMWTDERWLRWLAAELWATVWKPRALFEQAKRAPAMPLLLRRELRGIREGANVSAAERGGFEYLALDGTTVARFSAPALNRKQLAAMQRGVKHLRGMLFERVSRGLVRDCFEQAAAGVNPFTRLTWPHGFEGVATAYGINSKDRARLPELFEAMHAYRGSDRSIPPLIGGFWLTGATRGRAAELRCDVGEALAPGYASVVAGMPNTARGDEWLLPVLPVPLLALEGTAAGDYGALCDLQWELLALFRERAEEGRDRGGWLLSDADRAAVVDRAELRSKLAGAWLTPWTTGPRAWLRELPGGRLALVDEDAAELLREAANYTTTARNRGKRTKAKKMKLR